MSLDLIINLSLIKEIFKSGARLVNKMSTSEMVDYLPLLLPIGTIVAISVPTLYIAIHNILKYRDMQPSKEIPNTPASKKDELKETLIADLERMLKGPYPKDF